MDTEILRDDRVLVDARPAPAGAAPPHVRAYAALAGAAVAGGALVWACHVRGQQLLDAGARITMAAPPLMGGIRLYRPRLLDLGVAGAVVLAAAALALVRARRWGVVVAGALVLTAAWTVGFGLLDTPHGLTRPLEDVTEYLADVPTAAQDLGDFGRQFVPDVQAGRLEAQAAGHPPGPMVVLAALDDAGLGGPGWAAALCIGAGVSSVAAVLLTVREVAGEDWARRAVPFLVVSPLWLWVATSADALYLGLAAWTVLGVVLTARRSGRTAAVATVAAGVGAAALALSSYGLVLMATVPLATVAATWRHADPPSRRALAGRAATAAGIAVGIVSVVWWAWGFSWFDGLWATKAVADRLTAGRPYSFFVVNNLAAWFLVLGPAVVAGLVVLRHRPLWWLVAGGLAAGLIADVSGWSKGEVERIWLPFSIWVAPAGASLLAAVGRAERTHRWALPVLALGAQLAVTVGITAFVTTQW